MSVARLIMAAALAAPGAGPSPAPSPARAASACDGLAYAALDFWLGRWDVFLPDGRQAGRNHIEKVLGGCAVIEHWTDAFGREGKSLFYVPLDTRRMKQVWVTDSGPHKEKQLVEVLAGGGVRFEGEVLRAGGGSQLDRTTLTPLPSGHVRQLIEVSRDEGKTWQATFDAEYRRADGIR